jgi:HlyD family type I secretion membrane fusion protein
VVSLAALEARATAERDRANVIRFDHPALADRSDPMVRDAIEQETYRFEARKTSDQQRKSIVSQRSVQLNEQIIGFEKQLAGVREQIKLLQQETTTVDEMVSKGYDRLPRLLALKRSLADRSSVEGDLMANIARAREQIMEMEFQSSYVDAQRMEQVETELAETRQKRTENEELIRKVEDKVNRTVITAPSNGIVLNVRFKNVGGVIRGGEPVLDIVPTDDRLFIDTRISPKDIDDVHDGLSAYVIFPSYPQRRLHRISGKVLTVSADALRDEKTGEMFFTARVEVDREQLHKLAPQIALTPGLPAEVFITTIDRTLLEYLLQPLEMAFERSLREH